MDGGGSGGPAPFLLRTYDMVDDSGTDEIVSWSSSKNSFVVWNPPEFARLLLPTYFKHNNFSSFIRQLNTYGFRKIDPEKWEFFNEEFAKDQKHLLKNIHRRKPVHSHSHPQGALEDPERAAFEDEIERLSREKAALEAKLLEFKHHWAEKLQLENLAKKVEGMETRQENLLLFLKKAVQNPSFVEQLARKVESMDFSSYNKKRRLPEVDQTQPLIKNSFMDSFSSSRSEFGNMFQQRFLNKLRLELSPAVSDVDLVSCSTQSANDNRGSPERHMSEEEHRNTSARAQSLYLTTKTLDLSDTGTSFTLNMDLNGSRKGTPNLYKSQESGTLIEDGDGNISCHLNLTLASSPLQLNASSISAPIPQLSYEIGKSPESVLNCSRKEFVNISCKNGKIIDEEKTASPRRDPHRDSPESPPAAPVRVNDVFWEQFLTERPGCAENEEASSNNKANPYSELDSGRSGHEMYRNAKNINELSLRRPSL